MYVHNLTYHFYLRKYGSSRKEETNMEVQLNNKIYIQADEIVRMYPDAFKEGKKKPRKILEFKRIPQDDYIFGTNFKAGWKVSTEKNCKAKLLLTKSWVDNYITSLSVIKECDTQELQSEAMASDIKDAPPILDLTESEKFKDHKGKTLEIEVRGERDEDECFFRVKDVARCFNDVRIQDVILFAHSGFDETIDYIYLYRPINYGTVEQKKKELFFTYQGMLRYLFVSKNPNAKVFRKWASKILFAMQMGTIEQKQSVGAELFGVSPNIVSKFFGTCCVRDIPMAYLLKLTEPQESMAIPYGDHKNWLVVKAGQHGKEERKTGVVGRLKGHRQEFKEFKDSMEYMHFVFVDPMYVSDVEAKMKEYFSTYKLNYKNTSEVYLVHKSKLEDVKKFFRQLSIEYSGNHGDIQREYDRYTHDTKARMREMKTENLHLKEIIEQRESYYKNLIENLQERVAEQAETIRTHTSTIKAFITRIIPS